MKYIILYVTNTLYFPPKSWGIITEMQIILRYSFSLLQKMSKTQKVQQYTLPLVQGLYLPQHKTSRQSRHIRVLRYLAYCACSLHVVRHFFKISGICSGDGLYAEYRKTAGKAAEKVAEDSQDAAFCCSAADDTAVYGFF